MVDAGKDGVTITMKHLTLMISAGTILAALVATIVAGVMMYDRLNNNATAQKEDLSRAWAAIDDRRKIGDMRYAAIQSATDSFKALYETKYQQLSDINTQQNARIEALSNNLRILETNMNAISSNLTASIREEAIASSKILEKVNDLGTSFAELRADMKWIEVGRSPSPGATAPH